MNISGVQTFIKSLITGSTLYITLVILLIICGALLVPVIGKWKVLIYFEEPYEHKDIRLQKIELPY